MGTGSFLGGVSTKLLHVSAKAPRIVEIKRVPKKVWVGGIPGLQKRETWGTRSQVGLQSELTAAERMIPEQSFCCYFLAASKRLLTSFQFTTFHHAAR